jgi:hypothetical protein
MFSLSDLLRMLQVHKHSAFVGGMFNSQLEAFPI